MIDSKTMTKRTHSSPQRLGLLGVLAVVFSLHAASGPTKADSAERNSPSVAARPNIVFMLADDLGYGDTNGHGNPHVETPQLDRFAHDGVEFTHFYVSPFCHPTRASLMTGRYTQRTFREVSYEMDPAEVTVAEQLRDAGYRTGMFGKWHLGDGPDKCPNAQGFDEAVTFVKGQLPAKSYFDPVLLHNGKPQQYRGYCMDVFTDEAIAFIKQNRDKPFFVYLPANLIHTPLIAPPALIDPGTPRPFTGQLLHVRNQGTLTTITANADGLRMDAETNLRSQEKK